VERGNFSKNLAAPLPPEADQRVPKAFGIWKREVRRDFFNVAIHASLKDYSAIQLPVDAAVF
jgi:hypothetical protein